MAEDLIIRGGSTKEEDRAASWRRRVRVRLGTALAQDNVRQGGELGLH